MLRLSRGPCCRSHGSEDLQRRSRSDVLRCRSRRFHPSEDALHASNREHDRFESSELESSLDRERRLVVEDLVDQTVLLEYERTQEEDGPRVFAADLLAEVQNLLDRLGRG